MKNQKRIFRENFPTNPQNLAEKFSCNSDEGNCILEKSTICKSSEIIDMKLDFSSDYDRMKLTARTTLSVAMLKPMKVMWISEMPEKLNDNED